MQRTKILLMKNFHTSVVPIHTLGIKFLPNDVFHKLVFWDMRTKSNLKAFLLLWLWISLLGLIALASKRLGHCGHISSTFGKYFEAKEITKNMKNSYAKTAGLLACLLGISTRHVRSATSQVSWEHSQHGL